MIDTSGLKIIRYVQEDKGVEEVESEMVIF